MSAKLTLNVYPTEKGAIGKLVIPMTYEGTTKNKSLYTYVILDRSGSMGCNVNRIVTKVLPEVFNKLNYTSENKISIIAFDSSVTIEHHNISTLKNSKLRSCGTTYMEGAVMQLNRLINELPVGTNIRIMSISDGELHDQVKTLNYASSIANNIKQKYNISSHAFRYKTSSYGQPDTRGLASVLQFNNIGKANIEEGLSDGDNISDIVNTLVNMFINDQMNYSIILKSDKKVLKSSPWNKEQDELAITKGENILWLSEVPSELKINNTNIDIVVKNKLTYGNFGKVLQSKIKYFINQLKILKVINTESSRKEITQIIEYFDELETTLNKSDLDLNKLLQSGKMRDRLLYFKSIIEKKKKSVLGKLAEIANDDRVGRLNAAQSASYLRKEDLGKLSKSLAKRAEKFGFDFDAKARAEVRNVARHIHELDDIDDGNHYTSYMSMESTLGGLRVLADLVKDNLVDDMGWEEILQMYHIVGIGCNSVIGEFPDPMTYRINNLYASSYISIADIMMSYSMNAKGVKAVGYNDMITNVIPLFDDDRIHKFLLKHTPALLEYTASIGMRKKILQIPNTHMYTICAGLWKYVELINKDKSEININAFIKLYNTFEVSTKNNFNDIMQFLVKQDETMSYYINYCGITNMIKPLKLLIGKHQNDKSLLKHLTQRILRQLYSFETFQYTKKLGKDSKDPSEYKKNILHKLLGIDMKNKTKFGSMYEKQNPVHYNQYTIDKTEFNKISKELWYVDYISLLPKLLQGLHEEDSISYIKNIKVMDEVFIKEALGIEYDLSTFKFYNIVESLIYNEKIKRVDDKNNKMKTYDLGNKENAEKMVKDYVKKVFYDIYMKEFNIMKKRTLKELADELGLQIVQSTSIDKFKDLLKNGIKKGIVHAKMSNSDSMGYIPMYKLLINTNFNVPHRAEKLKILLLGVDNDEIVWNNGGIVFTDMKVVKKVYEIINKEDVYEELITKYREKNKHIYRDLPNRHGHSNDKPSYFALGFKTLLEMKQNVTYAQWNEYIKIHEHCCGVSQLLPQLKTTITYS